MSEERLLRSRPTSVASLGSASSRSFYVRHLPFQSLDIWSLNKHGQGLRSWIRVDSCGNSKMVEEDRFAMMHRCSLSARDMRLLDPMFVYPSKILGREKAIVVNMEQIRCIIMADKVFLLNSLDSYTLHYVVELRNRIAPASTGADSKFEHAGYRTTRGKRDADDLTSPGSTSLDSFPFEFLALEVALESACTFLDTQAAQLEIEAYPLLDELMSNVTTLSLERVRRLKSRLVELTRRVQKVRGEIEHLMNDKGDMAEMHLTEKMQRTGETASYGDGGSGWSMIDGARSFSAPVSRVSSPYQRWMREKKPRRSRRRTESVKSWGSGANRTEELAMLLEAHSVVISSTLKKLTSMKEHIDCTEDFINIQLDNDRNQTIQYQLILTAATFSVMIITAIAATFGINIKISWYDNAEAFQWVLVASLTFTAMVFSAFILFFKRKESIKF
ncbi:hypothetical protein MLD38_008018 [Melastoma candidum]|uniref:Uncharacterized protein n=1 Tax=Melastoma candidum TaxID=119954 RepID=A0ACB9RSK3_9MYRT|nr:hypothetical protein MLD38_008018 [Melastoma candidum]